MNKEAIRNLIIIFLVIVIILIIFICTMNTKKNSNNNILTENNIAQEEYMGENIITKEHYKYNEFDYKNISTKQLLEMYFNEYKYDCANDMQAAFNSLDEEYREKKFGTYEEYANYMNSQLANLIQAKIEKYDIKEHGNYKEYILQDQYGKIYIFKVTAVMEYTLFLDEYTVPTTTYIEEYNNADGAGKATINLNKFLKAIKNMDYKYAYSKLDAEFKNNNFITQIDFENYINQGWFDYESVGTLNIENQNGQYLCTFTIENIEKTFTVQLMENTEYTISFIL